MSFIPLAQSRGGAAAGTLSGLVIDADKDWQGKGIYNLGFLVSNMNRGDLVVFGEDEEGNTRIVKLPPADEGKVLCSAGPGKLPFWAWVWDEPGASKGTQYTYSVELGLFHSQQAMALAVEQAKEASVATSYGSPDGPNADWFKKQDGNISTEHTEDHKEPDKSHTEEANITSEYEYSVS